MGGAKNDGGDEKSQGNSAGSGNAEANGISNPGGNGGAGGSGDKGPDRPKTFHFFVGKDRYEATQASMKVSAIKALLPNLEVDDKLQLDGHGNDPDRLLNDDETISFEKQPGGPLRFTIVPGAGFGVMA